MTIGSHFMVSMKFKNWWVLIYLNTSRQIQIDSSFEFDCRIRCFSCHEFALFKLFGCLTFDNLTKSRQKNSLELTETQRKPYFSILILKKINLLGAERVIILISEFSLRIELCSLCIYITQIRFRYQWVIRAWLPSQYFYKLSSYLDKPPFIIWLYRITLTRNILTQFKMILGNKTFGIHQSYLTRFDTIKYWTEAYQGS